MAEPSNDAAEGGDFGLNAGLELDNEDFFKPGFEPGEAPELRDDISVLVALESRLHDLEYLAEDMRRTKGMSRAMALEAQRLLPDFGGVPIGYYSESPSGTRYQVSMEELSHGVMALIAAAIVAIIAAIVKLVGFFRGSSTVDKSPQGAMKNLDQHIKDVSENEQVLMHVQDSARETSRMLTGGGAVLLDDKGNDKKQVTMHSLVDDLLSDGSRYDYAKKFLENKNPAFHDIVTGGPYSKTIRSLAQVLPQANQLLRIKADLLEKVVQNDINSYMAVDKFKNMLTLSKLGKPIELRFDHGMKTLSEISASVADVRIACMRETPKKEMTLDQMVNAVVEAYRAADMRQLYVEIRDITTNFISVEKSMVKLGDKIGRLDTDGEIGSVSEEVGPRLREVVFMVGKDVTGYRQLFEEVKQFGTYLDRLANETMGFSNEIEKALLTMAKRGHLKLPEGWAARAQKDKADRLKTLFSR